MNQSLKIESDPQPGVVTSIKAQKKASDRVSVFIGGEFSFGVHTEALLLTSVSVGTHLTVEQISNLIEEDAYFKARDKAYHLLSYRPRSISELQERLARKGHPSDAIARVIDRLVQLRMLDDAEFASEFAVSRVRSKGYGPGRVRSELFKKGIAPDLISTALEKAYRDVSPEDLAVSASRKITDRLKRIEDPFKRRHRLTSYLARRGFSFDQMTGAIKELDHLNGNE